MQVSNPNNVKIYSITSASKSAIPDWMAQRNKKTLKHDTGTCFNPAWRTRIELVQDFEFPEASVKLKQTPDGRFLMATGVYKPQIRVWEMAQMAMKFERHTHAENILSDDWTKSVHLQSDRSVEFHSHYGMHYRTRVPKFGRDLAYHYPSCDLFVVGASADAWRINLEQGRFMSPFETTMPEINVVGINPAHQLLAFGGSDGKMEFWDHRVRKRIGLLNVGESILSTIDSSLLDETPQCSSVKFDTDGLSLLVGTSTGQVVLFDIRRPVPVLVKDHQYGYPIKSLNFHSSGNVVSADTKICKIWDKTSGAAFTSIEGARDINDVCVYRDSGLIMMANEGTKIQSYYIPALGQAPSWCSFLDNLTEEMEENPNAAVYDDYKFITKKELVNLNLEHLIGTNLLKAYMHGFFVDLRLYEKAKAISNPFEFEEHKKQMVQKRIQEKQASRISVRKNLPAVNQAMASKLIVHQDSDSDAEGTAKRSKKRKEQPENATAENPLGDARFADLFKDGDFQVDETSHEYKLHHPSESQAAKVVRNFEPVDQNSDGDSDDAIRFTRVKAAASGEKGKFFQIKDGYSATKPRPVNEQDEQDTFASRLKNRQSNATSSRVHKRTVNDGNRSITYQPTGGMKPRRDQAYSRSGESGGAGDRQKRGVKDLNLARAGSGTRGRGGSRGGSRGRGSRGGGRGRGRS